MLDMVVEIYSRYKSCCTSSYGIERTVQHYSLFSKDASHSALDRGNLTATTEPYQKGGTRHEKLGQDTGVVSASSPRLTAAF